MEVNNSLAKLSVVSYPRANGVVVNIGFELKDVNWFVLRKLQRREPCGCDKLSAGSEMSAFAYALYEHVCDRLLGDPKAQAQNKTSSVKCSYLDGVFTLHIECMGQFSAVRRVLSQTAVALAPHKVYPHYAAFMKMLNSSAKREEFDYCANLAVSGLKKLHVAVVGKINLGDNGAEKCSILLEALSDNMDTGSSVSGASKPASLKEKRNDTEFPVVKCKASAVPFVAEYLDKHIKVPVAVNGTEIIVYDKNFETKRKGLAAVARVKQFTAKFEKLADKKMLGAAFAYFGALNAYIPANVIQKLSMSNPSLGTVSDDIVAALK